MLFLHFLPVEERGTQVLALCYLGFFPGRFAKPTSSTAVCLQPEQRPFKQQLPTGAHHLPAPCLAVYFGVSFSIIAGTHVQTGVVFFFFLYAYSAGCKPSASPGCAAGREKKPQTLQPVECFPAPESSNTSLPGGAFAVAGTCCIQQPTGFPFQRAPARFWAKAFGERGLHLRTT